jgi:peroxiredoxin
MEELWKDFKEKDFVMLAVNLSEERTEVTTFIEEFGYSFPVLLDSTGEVGRTYGVQSIPTTYIIDKKGYVLARFTGTREWNTEDVYSAFSTLVEESE